MCVVSMVIDHYKDKWFDEWQKIQRDNQPFTGTFRINTPPVPMPQTIPVRQIPQADIDEFYKLLNRAREYDKRNNEPECEMQEKIDALKAVAKALGVEIEIKSTEGGE